MAGGCIVCVVLFQCHSVKEKVWQTRPGSGGGRVEGVYHSDDGSIMSELDALSYHGL